MAETAQQENERLEAELARLQARVKEVEGAAATKTAEAGSQPGLSAEQMLDEKREVTAAYIREALHTQNLELRSQFQKLAKRNVELRSDKAGLNHMMMRLTFGLEGMAADIRAVLGSNDLGEPLPPLTGDLYADNLKLQEASMALQQANNILLQEKESLQSQLTAK